MVPRAAYTVAANADKRLDESDLKQRLVGTAGGEISDLGCCSAGRMDQIKRLPLLLVFFLINKNVA